MKKQLLCAGLCLALLSGCATQPSPLPVQEANSSPIIAYVPLDDRPDNVGRVRYLAESLGYALEMPENDLYQTRLDGQPANENGTQSGDRAALFQWVLKQERGGCNRYILSLDQLLSGGLVNSRAMSEHEDLIFPGANGSELRQAEFDALEQLLSTLSSDPENRVWLLDSVMRLAPTVGYRGGTLEDYNALRTYGAQARPVLSGDGLSPGAVAAAYRLGADGRVLPLSDYGLSEETAASYLAARERKLTLTDDMLELLEVLPAENFRVLIGIDDSSVADSIQKNEIACFRARLRPGDALLSGVDDLAFKAVTRLYLDETGWAGVRARVQYFGGTEDQPACAYDSQPLTEILAEHFAFFDLTETPEGETPDLEVLVLTQPAEPERKSAYISALLQALKDCRSAGRPVILMDAGNGTYGTAFHSALTRETDLGWLLSYAGFLDMAIVTGTALSLGVARYARLTVSDPSAAENTAFAKTLADSIIKDFCYKNIVREDLLTFIRTDLGGDPNNFYLPEIDSGAVLARLKQGMQSAAKDVLQNLQHSNLIVSLSAYRASGGTEGLAGWGSITLSHYRFPWNRAFEIEMDMDLGGFTQPHKRLLGFWYR